MTPINKDDPHRFGDAPPCFESHQQWFDWNHYNETASIRGTKESFCSDCLPEYAEKMRDCGRCLYQEVKFYDINGGVMGSARAPNIGKPHVEKKKPDPTISAEVI